MGGEREIPNTTTDVSIDTLAFKVFNNYSINQIVLSLTGDLPLENIAQMTLGDKTLKEVKKTMTFDYTNKSLIPGMSGWDLKIVFSGDIE